MSLYVLAGPLMNAVARAGADPTLVPTADTDFPAANLRDGRANLPTFWSSTTDECTATVDLSMLADPGFETSTTEWTCDAGLAFVSSTKYVYAGTYSGELTSSGTTGTAYRDFSVRPGETLKLAWALYSPTTSAYVTIAVQNRHTGKYLTSGGTWTASSTTVDVQTAASWDTGSVTFDVEAISSVLVEPCTLRVSVGINGTDSSVYVDNVVLSPAVDFCSVHGHNFGGVSPRLQSADSTALFTTRETMTPQRDSFYCVLAAPRYERYWRLYLAGTPAETPYVGEWVLGQATALGQRPQYGGELELAETQSRIVGPAGQQWIYSRSASPLRRIGLEFLYETEANYVEARDAFYRSNRGGYHPCVVAPADMDAGLVVLGRIGEKYAVTKEHYSMRAASWEVVEDALPAVDWTTPTTTTASTAVTVAPTLELYGYSMESAGAVLGGAAAEAQYVPLGDSTLLTGLIHYWPMEQATDTDAPDVVGGVTLTCSINGEHVNQVAGKNGFAASLPCANPGTAGGLIKATGLPPGSARTFSAWASFSDPASGGCHVFGHMQGTHIKVTKLASRFILSDYTLAVLGSPGSDLTPETFYHLVHTYDGANAHNLYVNGAIYDSVSSTSPSWAYFMVGPYAADAGAGRQTVDELGWWNRVLTSDEIQELYNGGVGNVWPFNRTTFGWVGSGGVTMGGEAAASFQENALVADLIHYWPLDEESSTRTDIVGDLDLDTVVDANYGMGLASNALDLGTTGGPNIRSATGYVALDSNSPWSVSLWTKPPASPPGMWSPFRTGLDTYAGPGILIYSSTPYDTITAQLNDAWGGTLTARAGIKLDAWNHVIATYDGTDIRTYVNATSGSTGSGSWTPAAFTSGYTSIGLAMGGVIKGYGLIDEIGVWGRALTAAEISELYNGGLGNFPPFVRSQFGYVAPLAGPALGGAAVTSFESVLLTGLVAYWTMDEEGGTREDTVGVLDLTDNNSAGYDSGISGNAAALSAASSSYLSAADSTALRCVGDHTVSVWLNPTGHGLNAQSIVSKFDETSTGYWIYYTDAGKLNFTLNTTDGQRTHQPTDVLTDAAWNHLVFWASSSQCGSIINGGSATFTDLPGPAVGSTAQFMVGRLAYTGSAWPFDGLIDEVAMWNCVLSEDEIAYLYNSGIGRFYPFSS